MNVVFDLGGVVFNWQPLAIIRSVFSDARTQDLVKARIFEHADWIALDRGTLALDQAIARGASRTGLPRWQIEQLLNAVPRFLTPIQETLDLIRAIRDTDNKLFVLSNMHLASITHLEQHYDIWDMFDGVVISSRIQKVKPEIEIYEHLLTRYRLDAVNTVFIDDMKENLVAASATGIQTIGFADADQCRRDLAALGCF